MGEQKEVMPNPEPGKLRLSASRVAVYLHCPKKYWWMYEEKLQAKGVSIPLMVGNITHRLLHQMHIGKLPLEKLKDYDEVILKHYPHLTKQEAVAVASEALTLFSGYMKEYENDPLEVVSSEMHLESDRRDYLLYARLDGLVRTQDGRLWRQETKTTARLDSAYLSGLKGSIQAGISYVLIKEAIPEKVTGTIYNLIVKTKIPQYHRSPILIERHLGPMVEEMLIGVYEGITKRRFYPSMLCIQYSRECEYLSLCKGDSQRVREMFFTPRPDVIPTSNEKEEED